MEMSYIRWFDVLSQSCLYLKYFEFGYLPTLQLATSKMKFRRYIHVQCQDGAATLFPAYVRSIDRTQKTQENLSG